MDKKAVSEIRKLMTKDNCRIDKITGCFVGEDGTIIAELNETFKAMQDEELEKYCELFRKALSGKLGKNLFNMEFPLSEEREGGKQMEMYELVNDAFNTKEKVKDFLDTIISNLDRAGRHVIMLAHGVYDIPGRTSDGIDMEDASDNVYIFLMCIICPVLEVKEGLCFDESTLHFVNKQSDLGVQAPELGFLYPAFNDRLPDIHNVLYYAKKQDERHPELIDGIIGTEAQMPLAEKAQTELFQEVVEQTLGRACNFENVKALTEAVNQAIKEEKDNPEPVELGKMEMRRILHESGAQPENLGEKFDQAYDEMVGVGQSFTAENVGGKSVMSITSPSVKISIKQNMSSMITTKVIDGREYILIPVQEDVELNGIRLLTTQTNEDEY